MLPGDKDKKCEAVESEDASEPKGDPEMAPIYLRRLLPVFCNTFQSTMLPSVRYVVGGKMRCDFRKFEEAEKVLKFSKKKKLQLRILHGKKSWNHGDSYF